MHGWSGQRARAGASPPFRIIGLIVLLALPFGGCGGSGSSSSPPVIQNPVPRITSITPTNAPAGSRGLTLNVSGSNFISSSVVRWAGSDRATIFVSSAQLTASISSADLSNPDTVSVTVVNPSPGGGTSAVANFLITSPPPLAFLTSSLPDAQHNKPYDYAVQASGGIPPYSYSVVSGSLPVGLDLAADGSISGTPPSVLSDTASAFDIQLSDFAFQPNTLTQPFNIRVRAQSLGRNDSCGTATPIFSGTVSASISPYGDIDVYSFHGTAGNTPRIETFAQRLKIYGSTTGVDDFLDTFLELLDSNCNQLTYNDDISLGVNVDSLISNFVLPSTGTYYIRVSDLRGDGRPDFLYELQLSGAD
jgi:hypothetical protein